MAETRPRTKLIRADAQCAYCKRPATTKDHVVPKSLFPPPRPLDMITVPCCGPCNAEKKLADDFMRDYLPAIIDDQPSVIADVIRTGTLQRAVNDGHSKLHKQLAAAAQIEALTGVAVDKTQILVEPLKNYLWFAVKGLFHAKAMIAIPEDHKLSSYRLDGLAGLDAYYAILADRGQVNGIRIGDQRVFGCICQSITSQGILEATFWALIFYNRTFISCMTASPVVLDSLPEDVRSHFT